uniref:Uncharacterized protein n=1 Tax=Rhizophora mucronata TaxID=61149 RepID=A0A2P2PAH7_RHIMU
MLTLMNLNRLEVFHFIPGHTTLQLETHHDST